MRRAKIIATIGPASRDEKTLERLAVAGLDVARLNFSHGTPAVPQEQRRKALRLAIEKSTSDTTKKQARKLLKPAP